MKEEAFKELMATTQKEYKKKLYEEKEWYTCRSLLGNQWANWFIMAGARS